MVLLTMMAIVTIGIVRLRSLFAVVILSGIYSFLMASVMIVLDAVDVAMTEAASREAGAILDARDGLGPDWEPLRSWIRHHLEEAGALVDAG